MQNLSIYAFDYRITDSDVDVFGELKFSKMFSFFQDAASLHTVELGCDRRIILKKFNVVWILMRLKVEVLKFPRLFEKIKIETWPIKPKLRYERDFLIRDESGEILVKANSSWIVMDIDTKEISKQNIISNKSFEYRSDRAIDGKLRNLKMPKNVNDKIAERAIYISNIDINRHVNNSIYPDMVFDALGLSFQSKNEVKSIEINYINEIKLEDKLIIYQRGFEDSNTIFILGKTKNLSETGDEKIAFKFKIITV
ncbi:MAG: hypothetical protein LBD41_01650 [Clostridiales Family XIII bacterium]|nr:hypothetical protein [Clostridiales Family XIII bacterium]